MYKTLLSVNLGVLNSTLNLSFFHGDLEPGTHCKQSLICFIYIFSFSCKATVLCEGARHSDWRANREWLCAKITLHVTSPLYPMHQWGQILEVWPNTAAHLAGWSRVIRQVLFCTWWTGHTACIYHTIPALTGAAQLASWWNFQLLLLYSKCTQPSVTSCVTLGRHGLLLYYTHAVSLYPALLYCRPQVPNSSVQLNSRNYGTRILEKTMFLLSVETSHNPGDR